MKKYAYGGGGPGQQGGGGATDIRLQDGLYDDFDSLKSRIMVAAGAGAADTNDFGEPGGALVGYNSSQNRGKGGTQISYISGHQGCIAILENSTKSKIYSKTDGDVSVHYSGYKFENTQILDGKKPMIAPNGESEVGHFGNGYARISLIHQFVSDHSCNYNTCFFLWFDYE